MPIGVLPPSTSWAYGKGTRPVASPHGHNRAGGAFFFSERPPHMLFGKSLCSPFHHKNHCHSIAVAMDSIWHRCCHIPVILVLLQQSHCDQQLLVIYFVSHMPSSVTTICMHDWAKSSNHPLRQECYHHPYPDYIPILHMKKLRLREVVRLAHRQHHKMAEAGEEPRALYPKASALHSACWNQFPLECFSF